MGIQTNAGASISVSIEQPATYDGAGFNALTYTPISEIVGTGTKGSSTALVNHSALDKRSIGKLKGSINYGSFNVDLGLNLNGAGQTLLNSLTAGVNIDVVASFKETKQNQDVEYYQASVMSFSRNGGAIDSVIGASCLLELTGAIIDSWVSEFQSMFSFSDSSTIKFIDGSTIALEA